MVRRLTSLSLAAAMSTWSAGCQRAASHATQATSAASPAQVPDTVSEANARTADAVLRRIAGRENMPADSVFKNVKILNAVSAKTLVSIMAGGYARALGVKCSYCHVEEDFSSDEKRPKKAAREMAAMHRMINQELRKMQYIATP